jgi:hypothetical protein
LKQLQILALCNNGIRGGLVALAERGLTELRELNLSGNAVEDFNELRALSPLRSLRRLDLRWNAVRATPDYARLARALVPSLQVLDADSSFAPAAGALVVSDASWSRLGLAEEQDEDEPEDDSERDAEDDVVIMLGEADAESAPKRARIAERNRAAMLAAAKGGDGNEDEDEDDDSEFSTEQSSEEEEEEEEEEQEDDDDLEPTRKRRADLSDDPPAATESRFSPEKADLRAPNLALPASAPVLHSSARRPWKRLHTNWQGESDSS